MLYYIGLCKYTFAQRRNRLTTHHIISPSLNDTYLYGSICRRGSHLFTSIYTFAVQPSQPSVQWILGLKWPGARSWLLTPICVRIGTCGYIRLFPHPSSWRHVASCGVILHDDSLFCLSFFFNFAFYFVFFSPFLLFCLWIFMYVVCSSSPFLLFVYLYFYSLPFIILHNYQTFLSPFVLLLYSVFLSVRFLYLHFLFDLHIQLIQLIIMRAYFLPFFT